MNPQQTISWIDNPELYAKLTGIPLERLKSHTPKKIEADAKE